MRKCKNWLSSYLDYTKKAESPTSYHLWAGVSAVASALRRNVWIDMGFFNIYPNMYIVLVGPPACRKTSAINAAISIMTGLKEIHFSADSITREALIRAIKGSEFNIKMNDESIYTHSSLTIISKELSVFLGSNNVELLSLLTDLFDCPHEWEYKTKNMGTDSIKGVWVNLLGATTPIWLTGSIPMNAIGGGFTSRIIFVVEDAPRHREAIPILTSEEKILKDDLHYDLAQIASLKGEIKLTDEAIEWFKHWYETRIDPLADDNRFAGYSERKHIHLLKTAMILSASEGDSMTITKNNFESALSMLNLIEPKMVEAFGAAGRSVIAQDIDEVLKILKKYKRVSKQELLATIWRDVNYKDVNLILNALVEMNAAKIEVENGKMHIRLIENECSNFEQPSNKEDKNETHAGTNII